MRIQGRMQLFKSTIGAPNGSRKIVFPLAAALGSWLALLFGPSYFAPGSWLPVPDSCLFVLGSWLLVPGLASVFLFLVPGSWWILGLDSWFLVLGFWVPVLVFCFLALRSWFLVPGSWFLVVGSSLLLVPS